MLEKFFKLSVYISAYIPIFVMIFLVNLRSFSSECIKNLWNKNPILWWALIIVSFLSFANLLLWLCMIKRSYRTSSKNMIELKNSEIKDADILNFFVTFIVPIMSLKPDSLPSIVMNLMLLTIEAVYVISNNSIYNNILLMFMGYHIYTYTDDKVLISKIPKDEINLRNAGAKQFGTTNIYYVAR
ncbi:hypothetical protein [Ligilactobacillus agilis]|uniref:hypothetical protein n=1 Tax=Ligilactobacillus agilis TaxID=1601 RepID=UPI003D8093A2